MSIRHAQDLREHLPPAPLPSLSARAQVPTRLLRPTQPETTGVSQALNGYMFTDVKPDELMKLPPAYRSHYWYLREKFTNRDLWDTLTEDVVGLMLSPREEYDPDYQRQVNIALLTCIKTLENKVNGR